MHVCLKVCFSKRKILRRADAKLFAESAVRCVSVMDVALRVYNYLARVDKFSVP